MVGVSWSCWLRSREAAAEVGMVLREVGTCMKTLTQYNVKLGDKVRLKSGSACMVVGVVNKERETIELHWWCDTTAELREAKMNFIAAGMFNIEEVI